MKICIKGLKRFFFTLKCNKAHTRHLNTPPLCPWPLSFSIE